MTLRFLVCVVMFATACGSSASSSEEGASGGPSTGGEGGDEHVAMGTTEHECSLEQSRVCPAVECAWVRDPGAPEPATATATEDDEDPSLRDDVTIGPRTAMSDHAGESCVLTSGDGECPAICCSPCPRE